MKNFFLLLLLCGNCLMASAQDKELHQAVRNYFNNYSLNGYRPHRAVGLDSMRINTDEHELLIYPNEPFCSQVFTENSVKHIYEELEKVLPEDFRKYDISIFNKKGLLLEELIPNLLRKSDKDSKRLWSKKDYKGRPWVENTSLPYKITRGLQNRHLFIWASHGRYFKATEGIWKWQRPYLFCTTEDIFTQSFVYPFLFPMLEKAGAIVGSPRERDYQTQEAIVDNNRPNFQGLYKEISQVDSPWDSSPNTLGFATPDGLMNDSVFPFQLGTYRYAKTTNRKERYSSTIWTPNIPVAGKYAVYVSYASLPNSVPDANYTVYHKGGSTSFKVNQQMGGGTWVYLGTFNFDENQNENGRVVLTNRSKYKGVVTADAVRFGGGMGRIERGSAGTSVLPCYLEAARYYAQWSGVPDSLVNTEHGTHDYNDDLRVRGNMLNYLAGGSVFVPEVAGQHIPFELSLALHSDAGVRKDQSFVGPLSISTTQDREGNKEFKSELSRQASSDFASLLLYNLKNDLSLTYARDWTYREHWDRNYAETRMPDVPSAILEMLSHQNFTDMKYGHDPFFKFTLARSVYKTILRFVNAQHGIKNYEVQPLPVKRFSAILSKDGSHVHLSWQATEDPLEKSAKPNGYVVYTKINDGDFDNGIALGNVEEFDFPIAPNKRYAFQITAVNDGGESFPSETLSAFYTGKNDKRVLIVNGFNRLSGPAQINTPEQLGFDLDEDLGVPYLRTTAFAGRQQIFDVNAAGLPDTISLGFSGNELMGQEFAGNTFDYPVCHGKAIAATQAFSYASISREAFEVYKFNNDDYDVIDYIAGLEGDFKHNLRPFKTFPAATQQKLTQYLQKGGALLVSGSYIGSDNQTNSQDRNFIENVLKYKYDGSARNDSTTFVQGLGLKINIYRTPSRLHYAAQAPNSILPADDQAFSSFIYGGGQGAGTAYKGNKYRVIALGFPFECIEEEATRRNTMSALLSFLTK